MDLEIKTETVEVAPRVLRAQWTAEAFRAPRKSDLRYLSYKQGKLRTVKQRNKVRLSNVLVMRHNSRVATNRIEQLIATRLSNEIRKEIDAEILASLLGYGELRQKLAE